MIANGIGAIRREGSINMPYGVRIQRDCNQMKLAQDSLEHQSVN